MSAADKSRGKNANCAFCGCVVAPLAFATKGPFVSARTPVSNRPVVHSGTHRDAISGDDWDEQNPYDRVEHSSPECHRSVVGRFVLDTSPRGPETFVRQISLAGPDVRRQVAGLTPSNRPRAPVAHDRRNPPSGDGGSAPLIPQRSDGRLRDPPEPLGISPLLSAALEGNRL